MNMNNIVQTFKTVVDDFNLVDGQNRGLHLGYHIFSSVTDTVIYNLEITILPTQEKVSLPCYILLEDDRKSQILRTLQLLDMFIKLTSEKWKIMDVPALAEVKQHEIQHLLIVLDQLGRKFGLNRDTI